MAGGGSALRRHRPDVLSWQTEPLTADVTVAGDIVADLFASTTGTDSDWVVKLIDVYRKSRAGSPMGGYQLMVADEVLRGRFRKSFEHPKPGDGQGDALPIDLHTNDHAFLRAIASWCRCRARGFRCTTATAEVPAQYL